MPYEIPGTRREKNPSLTLSDYIYAIGDQVFAKEFGLQRITAQSYRLGVRSPATNVLIAIYDKTPVTYEGVRNNPGRPYNESEQKPARNPLPTSLPTKIPGLTLAEYIAEQGDKMFAHQLGIAFQTARNFRLEASMPERNLLDKIYDATPVTFEGIRYNTPIKQKPGRKPRAV